MGKPEPGSTITITLQREKCIGCNYCAEHAPDFFRMSTKDGKSNLLHSTEKRGFFTLRTKRIETWSTIQSAAKSCPVKIIRISSQPA